jgi:hypothetical protein
MPVYLELFHGRKTVTEQLDDWGTEGPILGPLKFVHTTYATDIKLETADGRDGMLHVVGEETPDLLYYEETYYGDWSVFGGEILESNPALRRRVEQFDPAKASAMPVRPAPEGTGHETEARM